MPKHSNDNDTPHVILEEDRAGNVRPVLAPLPEPRPDLGWGGDAAILRSIARRLAAGRRRAA